MKVGIDLGTTYSLVARMNSNGKAELLPDYVEHDVVHTPSVVCITAGGALVGRMAETLLEQDPAAKVVRFFKRHLGNREPVFFDDRGGAWHPEAVSALVLKKLRFDAETYGSGEIGGAVITVPAHFNDPQRKAVLAAAMLADLPVLGLVEEPVAAALHYGVLNASHDQILLVYDFGGGTFDATVLSLDTKGVYVLSKTGLTELGGKELDERIGGLILGQFERALGAALTLNARTLLELRRVSEDLKIELCSPGKTHVRRVVVLGTEAVEVEVSRREFEASIADLIDRTEAEVLRCVKDAGLNPKDIHCLLLVGGSSMVPAIEQRLKRLFHHPGQRVLYHEPSKAVAFGAALHATQLSGDAELYQLPPELHGVTGYCVGVRALNSASGRVDVDTLIKKNMPLPARAKKTYYTTRPQQDRVVLDFVQFRDSQADLISLGQLVVGPLPSPRQNYPIEVTVEYREDGTVAVVARDAQTDVELEQVFGRDADGGFGHLGMQRALVRSTFINNAIG